MSSGFVTESELEDRRKKRQEEWEQVRKPEDPVEAPEEEYDSRSLFERLQEQKNKKQEEWDETHLLKNQVRGIDEDEAKFLDQVDNIKTQIERKRRLEEKAELEAYHKLQSEIKEKELDERRAIEMKRPKPSGAASKQSKLLAGAIVKKKSNGPPEKKTKALGALAGLGDYSSSEEES